MIYGEFVLESGYAQRLTARPYSAQPQEGRMELSKVYLKSILHYDPDTGIFKRLISPSSRFKVGDVAGTVNDRGYCNICISYKLYAAHRLAFLYMTGRFPPYQVDHINGNRRDNRWANLRAVTGAENAMNAKMPKHNTSGNIGVIWHKAASKWCARIKVQQISIHIGLFDDKEAAVAARKAAEKKYGFHENHGRTI